MFCGFSNFPRTYVVIHRAYSSEPSERLFLVLLCFPPCGYPGQILGVIFAAAAPQSSPEHTRPGIAVPLGRWYRFSFRGLQHIMRAGAFVGVGPMDYGLLYVRLRTSMCTDGSFRTWVVRTDYLEYSRGLCGFDGEDGRQKNNKC